METCLSPVVKSQTRVQQVHCSLLLQVQSSCSLKLFFCADRVTSVLGTGPRDALGCARLLILGEHVERLVLNRARTWLRE